MSFDSTTNNRENKSQINSNSSKSRIFSQGNEIGDLFWPLILILKVFGHTPLSYVDVEDSNQKIHPSSQGKRKDAEESGINRESSSLITISVLHVDAEKKNVYSYPSTTTDIVHANEENEMFMVDTFHKYQYKIVWKSMFLVWSVLVALLYVPQWASFIKETHGKHGPLGLLQLAESFVKNYDESGNQTKTDGGSNATTEVVLSCIKIFLHIVPITHLSEIVLSWSESISFGHFLNNWASFHRDFYQTFPYFDLDSGFDKKIIKYRNLFVLLYVGSPSVIISFLLLTASLDSWLNSVLVLPCIIHACTVSLLEDVKVILSYRALALAFSQIKDGMAHSIQNEKLGSEKIKSWRKLVHKVRLQNSLVGKSQKTHQLVLLVASMLMVTIIVFILLNGTWRTSDGCNFGLACFFYAVMLVGRLYVKILAAHLIVHNESLVAKELININTSEHDFSVQLEIKFLHDMIKQTPSSIEFGNYVTLNKKLILGIASQVVTYLIVMMQFSQSQGSISTNITKPAI